MSAAALSLARPIAIDISPVDPTPASIQELASLGVASVAPSNDTPELLRLGPELPAVATSLASRVDAPPMTILGDIARIGAHLGPLERAASTLSGEERALVSDRLAKVRVLVDCASALADLRAGVHASMRTARAA
jgi:hypothetical protein